MTGTKILVIVVAMLACGVVLAGNVKCVVTQAGAPVAGASVTLDPGGATDTTNAAGICNLTGVAAGTYGVSAQKDIAGVLHGAISDGVVVPAAGTITVDLVMTRAVLVESYFPLAVGNTWQYRVTRKTATGVTTHTRTETVEGTAAVGGDTAMVILVTWSGSTDIMKQLRASSSDGYVVYGESEGGDTMMFDPPLRLGNLAPLGYSWRIEGLVTHTDGSPDEHMKCEGRLAAFEDVTVPAGTFTDCPRFDIRLTVGARSDDMKLWVADGVGEVRQIERNRERTNDKVLEEYRVGRPRVRPLRPRVPLTPARPGGR